jgi:glycosyltransferase involved in cell wall biosynthesis
MNPERDVTAVVPLFDKAAHVAAALKSIAGQTRRPHGIIVVDDGSTDGGDGIVERLALPGLRLIRQANAGPGAARNAGIAAAETPFVAFLDADDIWLPHHVERLARLEAQFSGMALYANRIAPLGAPGADAQVPDARLEDYAAAWLDGLIVSTIGAMVDRRKAQDVGGFSTAAHRGEDLALWLKLTRGRPMAMGGCVGALYRQEASDLTRRPVEEPDAAMRWIDAYLAQDPAADAAGRQALRDYRARLALLHAAEWIRFGGREKARRFIAMAEGSVRNEGRKRSLALMAGPLWPFRRAIIALRRRL